jgi:hypothetical protein
MVIPDWTSKAVIPMVRPVRPEEQALPENRSPFEATMTQVVERFALTPERGRLIHNLIEYRKALYAAGITDGFQWINGSFVEDVETRPRPGKAPTPDDIDIVTFYHLPGQQTPETIELFSASATSQRFDIDGYGIQLGLNLTAVDVESITYWYGMWSLRKEDHEPKGFVRVPLDPHNDRDALRALEEMTL